MGKRKDGSIISDYVPEERINEASVCYSQALAPLL